MAKRADTFYPANNVTWAELTKPPSFATNPAKIKGVKGKGLRYEKQICQKLSLEAGKDWTTKAGAWFRFEADGKERYAQPDWFALNDNLGLCCIVEVKLSRVERAWRQLNQLYKPVLAACYPDYAIALVEVAANVRQLKVVDDVKVITDFREAQPERTSFMRIPYASR